LPAPYPYPPTAPDTPPNPDQLAQLVAVARAAHTAIRADGPAELMAVAISELRDELDHLAELGITFELSEAWTRRIAERAGR